MTMANRFRVGAAVVAAVAGSATAFGVAGATPPPEFLNGFRSPTGNITCTIADKGAVCEIAQHTYPTPGKPADCYQTYGDRVVLYLGSQARFTCHGDTIRDTSLPVLYYDHSVRSGDVECFSERSGIRCTNARYGHWFRIAAEAYELH
ncbi:DUF6636 domain-containing protein [Nocardia sp. NPDC052566]|uniref:DUF6636 domain-containing protein n=1 Tax=Nocardia sp. NPDC052566 TaxID=3364330 RepID=UPI0037CB9477